MNKAWVLLATIAVTSNRIVMTFIYELEAKNASIFRHAFDVSVGNVTRTSYVEGRLFIITSLWCYFSLCTFLFQISHILSDDKLISQTNIRPYSAACTGHSLYIGSVYYCTCLELFEKAKLAKKCNTSACNMCSGRITYLHLCDFTE